MIPLLCIIILMIVALNFIWESDDLVHDLERYIDIANIECNEVSRLEKELQKYKRPRDSRGRFIKGGS